MTFQPGASLDPSQVEDVRGRRVGGRGVAIGGGGGLGLIILIAYVLLGGNPNDLGSLSGQIVGDGSDVGPASTALANECRTGADANAREDCRILGYINSVQAYWKSEFASAGSTYEPARTRFFTDQINTGCGLASAASGPFYCPATATSTSTWASSTTCAPGSARPAARSPRPTSSPTNTATTSRTSRAPDRQLRRTPARRAARSGSSCRPTATPGSGRTTRRRRATWCHSRDAADRGRPGCRRGGG